MPNEVARRRLRFRLRHLFNRIIVRISPNRSSRHGARVRASVVHTTESSDSSFWALVKFGLSPNSGVSWHYLVDAIPVSDSMFTRVAKQVPENEKAWTAKSANPVTVNYELIGRASRTRKEWLGKYRAQIRTLAALVAEDSLQYDEPVWHGFPGQLGHRDLSKFGFPNDHNDPGPNFPWDVFLRDVKKFRDLGTEVAVPVPRVSLGTLGDTNAEAA